MLFKRSTATHAAEGRGFEADLLVRTMAAPTRIAIGSLQDHSIHEALIGPCVPIHIQANPINRKKTRANIVAAIISLPLAASATTPIGIFQSERARFPLLSAQLAITSSLMSFSSDRVGIPRRLANWSGEIQTLVSRTTITSCRSVGEFAYDRGCL